MSCVRAFVGLRHLLSSHDELAGKLEELERRMTSHDKKLRVIFEAIRELIQPPQPTRRKIGFHVKERRAVYRDRR